MPGCADYLEVNGNFCPDAFHISGPFAASTNYRWELKSKFGSKFIGDVTTDADGLMVIPVDGEVISKDMFQPFSGAWEFRAYTVDDAGNEVALIFCGLYDYIVILFESVIPLPDPNNVVITLDCT